MKDLLKVLRSEQQENTLSYPRQVTRFNMKVFVHNCSDNQYEVIETIVDCDNYDEDIYDQVIFELEYESTPLLPLEFKQEKWFDLKVEGVYTKDYYGEVDLDITAEIIK